MVTTTVVVVPVGGDGGDDGDTKALRSGGDLADVVHVDRGSLICGSIYEEVGIVILADGDGDDPHSGGEIG